MESFLVFLALVVASATLYIQRQHNRKQLFPILHLYYFEHITDDFVERSISLSNDGQGAGNLQSFLWTIGDEEYEVKHHRDVYRILGKYLPEASDKEAALYFCVRPNSDNTLVSYKVPKTTDDLLKKSKISIKAQSLYGDIVIVNNHGYTTISNPRDALFEKPVNLLFDLLGKWISTERN
ncbi:hypothetical protein [Vibrio alginolyticus]|uniref:hypothetical protein n=1 Tax=Vibrio alginolyticus TaxID=663 RepID=UPI001EEEE61C|nr:hypothetical protein [Vibrio alginolyticus]ULF76932.1 hypothetical protein K6749_09325 [Vibrio alginolyticus]